MTSLAPTILAKSDQLNADDLVGRTLDITITKVVAGTAEQPIKVEYENGNSKPYYPCKTMRRLLVHAWGDDGKSYVGRSLRLYRDPEVMFGGIKVGGIRISHMSHIKAGFNIALTARRGAKASHKIELLQAGNPLKKAGDEAAAKGIEAYTQWLATLTPEQKAPLKQHHALWTTKAKSVIVEVVEAKEGSNEEETLAWE